jgi:Leucine-rich repeat (LRR) protein
MKKFLFVLFVLGVLPLQARFNFSASNAKQFVHRTLNFTEQGLTKLPSSLSRDLKPIVDDEESPVTSLNFSDNNIAGKLKKGTFVGLQNVEIINLNDNNLTQIEPHAFDDLRSLQWIYLSDNNLTCLKPDTFKHLTGLWGVKLDGNDLSHMSPEAFDDLRLLHFVSLANNNITRLESNMFADVSTEENDARGQVSNLEVINFSGNPIVEVQNNAFAELPNLRIVIISKCLSAAIKQKIKAGVHNANKHAVVIEK